MKFPQRLKCCFLSFIICTLVIFIIALLFGLTVPTALASSNQTGKFTDSTPYLVVSPSQLNLDDCHMGNNQTWTCVETLYGENINNAIAWSASSPISSISFNPSKGYLAKVASIAQVTISNIPCISTSILFSGQTLGSAVIPATATWNCTPKPTPTPIPQPSPTPKITVPTSTPVATTIPRPTPTMTLPPTSVISSNSQSDPPVKGNDNSSDNIFLVSATIFLVLESVIALALIAILIRRKISKT